MLTVLTISFVMATILGFLIDGKTGSSPLFTITGLILGLAVAGFGTYRMLTLVIKKNQD